MTQQEDEHIGTVAMNPAPADHLGGNYDALRPSHEAVNTRSHVKLSPSQANRILTLISSLGRAPEARAEGEK